MLGALYALGPVWLVIVAVLLQLISLPMLAVIGRHPAAES